MKNSSVVPFGTLHRLLDNLIGKTITVIIPGFRLETGDAWHNIATLAILKRQASKFELVSQAIAVCNPPHIESEVIVLFETGAFHAQRDTWISYAAKLDTAGKTVVVIASPHQIDINRLAEVCLDAPHLWHVANDQMTVDEWLKHRTGQLTSHYGDVVGALELSPHFHGNNVWLGKFQQLESEFVALLLEVLCDNEPARAFKHFKAKTLLVLGLIERINTNGVVATTYCVDQRGLTDSEVDLLASLYLKQHESVLLCYVSDLGKYLLIAGNSAFRGEVNKLGIDSLHRSQRSAWITRDQFLGRALESEIPDFLEMLSKITQLVQAK